ncbi:two-component system response regulator RssB [Edwardsiella tarda]|uniref:two-component system response regulator RssB n=1 Tax=Edwardsiella tarda TaxID=636 RepID=UPI00266EA550|nr:two-component system response regulator RssB [Edwardsiella tarda]WKS79947.1 two-component system response regulator RssB [Edwardsiella tarda]
MSQVLTNKQIMIVDDDAVFRRMLCGYLEAQGARVTQAENGRQALRLYEQNRPDLILCDLAMPEMDGADFLRHLRMRGQRTPVVVISATESVSDIARVMRLGAKDVLLKPVRDFDRLRQMLLACLYPALFDSLALEEDALSHDWQVLLHDPARAVRLLRQLQPPVQQVVAGCRVNYRQLTDPASCGLVLDMAALSAHEMAFYCLDVTRSSEYGVLAALMMRAIFNGLLQQQMITHGRPLPHIAAVLKQANQLLRRAGFIGQFPMLAGYYHALTGNVLMASAGLHACLEAEGQTVQLNGGVPLGTLGSTPMNQLCLRSRRWQCQIWGGGGQLRLMLTAPDHHHALPTLCQAQSS